MPYFYDFNNETDSYVLNHETVTIEEFETIFRTLLEQQFQYLKDLIAREANEEYINVNLDYDFFEEEIFSERDVLKITLKNLDITDNEDIEYFEFIYRDEQHEALHNLLFLFEFPQFI